MDFTKLRIDELVGPAYLWSGIRLFQRPENSQTKQSVSLLPVYTWLRLSQFPETARCVERESDGFEQPHITSKKSKMNKKRQYRLDKKAASEEESESSPHAD